MKENEFQLSRAKRDLVVGTRRTGEQAGFVILRVAISIWAPVLEEFGVCGRTTASRSISATILIGLEHCTRVVASTGGLQLTGALPIDVSGALDAAAAAEVHGDVEAIDKGDVDVVEVIGLV